MSDNPGSAVVHVVDDDEAIRQSLAFMLSSAGLPVRVYESAIKLLESIKELQAGCIVTDVRMPDLDGVELIRRLRALSVDLPAIVITGHGDVPLAVEAMRVGAFDFIEKPFEQASLLDAIRRALASNRSAVRDGESKSVVSSRVGTLSERERQVLAGLVAGQPNKIIAHNLGISPRTVEVHRANVMNKMQAKNFSELVRMALLAGSGAAIDG